MRPGRQSVSSWLSAAALSCVVCACEDGAFREEQVGANERQEIIGGAPSPGDEAVFYLETGTGFCSSTLIAPRTLLTAAHCVDQIAASTIRATNVMDLNTVQDADWYQAIETRIAPSFNVPLHGSNDLGLVLLDRAPPVSPKPWNAESIDALKGKPARAVGYGTTSYWFGGGEGLRRTVALEIAMVDGESVLFNGLDAGICFGDSGGPGLYVFPDGIERIIGVHSWISMVCTEGRDQRVDVLETFIRRWLSEKEGIAWCELDSKCASGCALPDPDCACEPDGQCLATCADLLSDPDCPAECADDGTCTLQACPRPDPDCVAVGSICSSELECEHRLCTGDPQHPTPYCSLDCTQPQDCPSFLVCADGACRFPQRPGAKEPCVPEGLACLGGLVCDGVTREEASCVTECGLGRSCSSEELCASGFRGHYCAARPPAPPAPMEPSSVSEPAPASESTRSGCESTSQLSLPALGALMALLRRRRAIRRG